ncbi:hypothetical protein MD484_g5264, partial [Candolleomyces efflorescens]
MPPPGRKFPKTARQHHQPQRQKGFVPQYDALPGASDLSMANAEFWQVRDVTYNVKTMNVTVIQQPQYFTFLAQLATAAATISVTALILF